MGLTAAQLEERRAYLGGTDLAALAGLSTWAKPIDVWLDKTGQAPERTPSKLMALGSLMEDVVAQLFTEATGVDTRRAGRPVRDRLRPWLGGHVDRFTSSYQGDPLVGGMVSGVLECKWTNAGKDDWGESGTGTPDRPAKMPADYYVQLQHYLGVTGRPIGYMAVLLGYADFRWYMVWPDHETIGQLRELGTRFWHDNVLTNTPPEEDGSESYARWLTRRYAKDAGTEAVATTFQRTLWRTYWQHEDARAAAESARDKAKQQLISSMKTTAKLALPDGTIGFRSYEQADVDWHAVAEAVSKGRHRRLAAAITTATTTSTRRPFRPKRNKEDD